MKPHPRIRKAVKWGGLALCLLLAGVWVRSEWVYEGYGRAGWYATYSRGLLVFQHWEDPTLSDGLFSLEAESETPSRWWWRQMSLPDGGSLSIPLWMPLAGTLLATAAAWRLDALARRRARLGACAKCGYDRAGLATSAVCPECGASARS